MRIDILTVVPELLESPLSHSIVGRAINKGIVEIHVHNLRKYGKGPRQQVDDYSYGGDAGMVLMLEPVFNMIQELKAERDYDEVSYMSPDGEILNQNIYDDIYVVTDEEALETSRRLAREEGLMVGISAGTNVAAALKLAKKLGKGKTVVTVLPDTAERYFSTPLFME